ncbi:MAG: acetyl-CoA carboxylase carboxyltransferase subunit alpha [Candidatus Coatesbacteria bacterium]
MAYEVELDFEKPLLEVEKKIEELRAAQKDGKGDRTAELEALKKKADQLKVSIYANLTPWQRVLIARHPRRPYALDYIGYLFQDFIELHGDRHFSDDPAVVCGFAKLDGRPVMVLGQQKGRDMKESLLRNFGMMNPEGYRKAMRFMHLAEKFGRPVVIFIDTMGAYPGIGAEERGQAEAIARNLMEMSLLRTPIVAVVIGEGGSGGALGVGVADRVLILENAVYSVISPEGCAAILWRSAKFAPEAAKALRITAKDLTELGITDEVIPEPPGGAHRDPVGAASAVKIAIRRQLEALAKQPIGELLDARYGKFRAMGVFTEAAS